MLLPSAILHTRKPGVHFAFTAQAVELPIIDVTNPAFAIEITPGEQRALVEAFQKEGQPLGKLPGVVRRPLLRFFLRQSVLGRGIQGAQGSFLSGMGTYLLKLGPDWFTQPLDQKIASGLPALSVRLRLQDMAYLIADALTPQLEESKRPLRLLNIAGGPAMDSLNALLLLKRDAPHLLSGRPILIQVLDRDADGPLFGERALFALRSPGGPLAGLDITLQRTPYDWSRPSELMPVLKAAADEDAIVLASSEGGLFEYGSDDGIVNNLIALAPEAIVVGSVTRSDETMRLLKTTSQTATIPRGLEAFESLARQAGWRVEKSVERPLSDQVVLRPTQR